MCNHFTQNAVNFAVGFKPYGGWGNSYYKAWPTYYPAGKNQPKYFQY